MIIKWINSSQIRIIQLDTKTIYLLNGLYKSDTLIQTRLYLI